MAVDYGSLATHILHRRCPQTLVCVLRSYRAWWETWPHSIFRSEDSTHSHTGAGEPSVQSRVSQTLTETSQTSAVASSSFILWKRPFVTESHSEANQPRSPHWSEGFFSPVGFHSAGQRFQRWPESHGSSSRLREQREERRRRIEWIGLGLICCSSPRCADRGTHRPFESPDTWSVRGAQPAAGRQLWQVGVGGGRFRRRPLYK